MNNVCDGAGPALVAALKKRLPAELVPAAVAAQTLPSPPPCSLNGVLQPSGECACDSGWSGAECEALALLPAAPLDAASQAFLHAGDFPEGCGNTTCPQGPTHPVTNTTSFPRAMGSSVARALRPEGPWERVPWILPDNQTNPSAIVLANGTILVTARRWNSTVPLYVSRLYVPLYGWRGPYIEVGQAPVVLVPAGQPPPATAPFDEDPDCFVDSRGGLHCLTHRQPLGDYCPPLGAEPSDCRCAGGAGGEPGRDCVRCASVESFSRPSLTRRASRGHTLCPPRRRRLRRDSSQRRRRAGGRPR
jgi:hypothetical protein